MGDPTRDRFARRVAIAVRVAGGRDIDYDEDEFCLRFTLPGGGPMVANLDNVFTEWGDAPVAELTGRIQRFAAIMVNATTAVTDWEFVASRLRPVLNPVQMAEHAGMRTLTRPFLPFVDEMVVIDHPDRMQYVLAEDPARWGVGAEQVFDRARSNLAARAHWQVVDGPADGKTILRMPETGSDYWVSHLVLDGWLAGVGRQLGDRPVAFVADRSGITIVGDEPEAVAGLLELAEKEYLESARSISPQAYTVDGSGRVVPYTVPRSDPLWSAVHRSEVLLASTEYAVQKEQAADGFLASYSVGQRDDDGVYSVSVWGEGVDTLLPETEYVAVVDEARETSLVPWDTVVRVAGIRREPGWSPPRYRARAWPTPERLGELRAAAVRP